MPRKKKSAVSLLSLAAPAVLLAAIGGVLSAKVGLFDDLKDGVDLSVKAPVTVTIAPREMSYRAEGHFLKNGFAVDAPIVVAALKEPLEIMKYQVTRQDYERCVADGACQQPPAVRDRVREGPPGRDSSAGARSAAGRCAGSDGLDVCVGRRLGQVDEGVRACDRAEPKPDVDVHELFDSDAAAAREVRRSHAHP